jgi:hypothetical protein
MNPEISRVLNMEYDNYLARIKSRREGFTSMSQGYSSMTNARHNEEQARTEDRLRDPKARAYEALGGQREARTTNIELDTELDVVRDMRVAQKDEAQLAKIKADTDRIRTQIEKMNAEMKQGGAGESLNTKRLRLEKQMALVARYVNPYGKALMTPDILKAIEPLKNDAPDLYETYHRAKYGLQVLGFEPQMQEEAPTTQPATQPAAVETITKAEYDALRAKGHGDEAIRKRYRVQE